MYKHLQSGDVWPFSCTLRGYHSDVLISSGCNVTSIEWKADLCISAIWVSWKWRCRDQVANTFFRRPSRYRVSEHQKVWISRLGQRYVEGDPYLHHHCACRFLVLCVHHWPCTRCIIQDTSGNPISFFVDRDTALHSVASLNSRQVCIGSCMYYTNGQCNNAGLRAVRCVMNQEEYIMPITCAGGSWTPPHK